MGRQRVSKPTTGGSRPPIPPPLPRLLLPLPASVMETPATPETPETMETPESSEMQRLPPPQRSPMIKVSLMEEPTSVLFSVRLFFCFPFSPGLLSFLLCNP